jgi:hypothetical protein
MKSNRLGLSGSSHGLGGSNRLILNLLWLSSDTRGMGWRTNRSRHDPGRERSQTLLRRNRTRPEQIENGARMMRLFDSLNVGPGGSPAA